MKRNLVICFMVLCFSFIFSQVNVKAEEIPSLNASSLNELIDLLNNASMDGKTTEITLTMDIISNSEDIVLG